MEQLYRNVRDTGMTENRNKRQLKTVARLWIVFLFLAAILAVLLVYKFTRKKGIGALPIYDNTFLPEDMIFSGGNDEIAPMVQDNYYAYLKRAYFMFGTYPDCEFYKISDKVERNQYNWTEDFYTPDGEKYMNYYAEGKKKGQLAIDVSEFNGEIDWKEVKKAGFTIVIVRVGYRGYASGTILADETYEKNIRGAAEAGLTVGVYFYSQAINREEGIEEAKFVLEKIKGLPVKGPVICDSEEVYEDENARCNVISVEERTDAVQGFLETVESAKYKPMLYASIVWLVKYLDMDRLGGYPLWLACYDADPEFPYHTEAWQYSPYGEVPGISHETDLNVWMTTY